MKNKLITFLVVLIVLSVYPIYRYKSNARIVVNTLLEQVKPLGTWSYGSVSSDFSGQIDIRNLVFTPVGFKGGFDIRSLKLLTDKYYILKHSAKTHQSLLPEYSEISLNEVSFNSNSDDLYRSIKANDMWHLIAGFGGSFGCNQNSFDTFSNQTISQILTQNQMFNLDFSYSREWNKSIEFMINIDVEELFFSSWTGNLEPSYVDRKINPSEFLVNKIKYLFLDYNFNEKRNEECAKNYNANISAYQTSSLEHLQDFLRRHSLMQLPTELMDWYKQSLIPGVEFGLEFEFKGKNYITDIYNLSQRDFFANALIKVSKDNSEYKKVELVEVDFTEFDQQQLIREHQLTKSQKPTSIDPTTKSQKKEVKKLKPSRSRLISKNNLSDYIGKRLHIQSLVGRPLTGELLAIDAKFITFKTSSGADSAVLRLAIDKIEKIQLAR